MDMLLYKKKGLHILGKLNKIRWTAMAFINILAAQFIMANLKVMKDMGMD